MVHEKLFPNAILKGVEYCWKKEFLIALQIWNASKLILDAHSLLLEFTILFCTTMNSTVYAIFSIQAFIFFNSGKNLIIIHLFTWTFSSAEGEKLCVFEFKLSYAIYI